MWLFLILSLLISATASIYCRSTFKKYGGVSVKCGMTGAETARQMLLANGNTDVQIAPFRVDHYDPAQNTIKLSPEVLDKSTVTAVGVAMHEAGHALQYADSYVPVRICDLLALPSQIASYSSYLLVVLGVLFTFDPLITIGIWVFVAVVLFQLMLLPVENNASGRALRAVKEAGILTEEEQEGMRKVLTAAAMTYVAGFVVAVLQLMRLLLLRGSRR